MNIKPCISLMFSGQCEEAFKFYEKTLGGQVNHSMKWGGSPMEKDAPPEWADKLLYISMTLGGVTIVGGDLPPGMYVKPQGFGIMLNMTDVGDAERVFQTLSEGGNVNVPLGETFWAAKYGYVTDRFGIAWEVNCEKPQ